MDRQGLWPAYGTAFIPKNDSKLAFKKQ